MLYAIMGTDAPDSPARPEHLKRLNEFHDAGRLLLVGPFPAFGSPDPGPAGFSGSRNVADFESLAAAQSWADADPCKCDGVFDSVCVRPFRRDLPT